MVTKYLFAYRFVTRFPLTYNSRNVIRRPARALLGGRIIFNNHGSVFDCTIRQLSDSGAVLQLGSTFAVPQVFILETKPFKQRYQCTVAQRTATTIEVAFLTEPQAAC